MLRIVVQLLLALSLVLQGPTPVLAAVSAQAAAQDDCMLAMTKDDGGKGVVEKQDCCKRHCTPAACIQVCAAGGGAFLAPGPFGLIHAEPARNTSMFSVPFAPVCAEGPPIRPPIV